MKLKIKHCLFLLLFLFIACQKNDIKSIPIKRVKLLQDFLTDSIYNILRNDIYNNVNIGIQISTIDGKNILFNIDENKPYITASALKVIPSAISLIKFGPDYIFKTPLMTDGKIEKRILKGNLYICGRGDPSLKISHLEDAVEKLKAMGIAQINGDIYYDISYLDEEKNRYPPNARNLYAPPCALTVNYNWINIAIDNGQPPKLTLIPETSYAKLTYNVEISSIDTPGRPEMFYHQYNWGDHFTIKGTITRWDKKYHYVWLGVSRPGLYGATLFKEICIKKGIIITGTIKKRKAPKKARILMEMNSSALKEAVQVMNQESNNVIAELLNKNLGAEFHSVPGTRQKGLEVLRDFCIKEIRLQDEFNIDDASGLSVKNRFSAYQFTQALNYFHQDSKIRNSFLPTLARQGHHPHAMLPVPPDNLKILVKTGTLSVRGVNTVIGYIIIEKFNEAFSFAVLANRQEPGLMTYSGTLTNPILIAIVKSFKKVYP